MTRIGLGYSAGERFDIILRHKNLVVERIVRSALIVAQEYVQAQDEWVLLVQGEAVLHVAGEAVVLAAGDYLFLPARVPHRVERTSPGALWLAVHLHPDPTAVSDWKFAAGAMARRRIAPVP